MTSVAECAGEPSRMVSEDERPSGCNGPFQRWLPGGNAGPRSHHVVTPSSRWHSGLIAASWWSLYALAGVEPS
jgi:hypothetical protein